MVLWINGRSRGKRGFTIIIGRLKKGSINNATLLNLKAPAAKVGVYLGTPLIKELSPRFFYSKINLLTVSAGTEALTF